MLNMQKQQVRDYPERKVQSEGAKVHGEAAAVVDSKCDRGRRRPKRGPDKSINTK
jgi:hypothetical protein